MPAPSIGSIVKVYPRISEDPNPWVGRGTYLGTEEGVHRVRLLPFGQVRVYDATDFEVSPNTNSPPALPAPTIPVPVGGPTAPPMLGGKKRRQTRRPRRHARTRKHTRKH